jgi:spoIIIJ-associated protein
VSTYDQHLPTEDVEARGAVEPGEAPEAADNDRAAEAPEATETAEAGAADVVRDVPEGASDLDPGADRADEPGDEESDGEGSDEESDGEESDGEESDGEESDGEESDGESDGEESDGESDRPRGAAARLEREGEIAADFLERLLDIADLDGDLDVDVEGERASVAIVDSSEGRVPRRLVGHDGEVLEALQELTRLAVQARTGDRSRLMLDVAGHRARRREQLVARAKEAIGEVKETGEPLRLEAMNPFERKIVHDAVAAAGLSSSSEGVEPDRRIVVRPAP